MSEKYVQQILDARETCNVAALNIGAAEGRYIPPLADKFSTVHAFEADIWSPGKVPAIKEAYKKALISPSITEITKLTKLYENAIISSGHAPTVEAAYKAAMNILNQGVIASPFNWNNVYIIPKAVNSTCGKVKLYISDLNIGRHTINENHWQHHGATWGYSNKAEEVDAVTIDEYCKELVVGCIVCDIEGGEAFIFEGAKKTLANNEIDVIIELHDGINFNSMIDVFTELDYRLYLEVAQSDDGMNHALFSNRDQWKINIPDFMQKFEF